MVVLLSHYIDSRCVRREYGTDAGRPTAAPPTEGVRVEDLFQVTTKIELMARNFST